MKTLVLFVVSCALAIGCSSSKTQYRPAAKAATSLEKAADTIQKSNAQVDAALVALTTITQSPADLKKPFSDFNDAVAKLEATQRDIASKAVSMQENRQAFFAQWEQDVAAIRNEDVRAQSQARKTELQAQFAKVRADYQQAQQTFGPFVNNLRDIRTALSIDLSAQGVSTITPLAAKVNADAVPVRQSLTNLVADFRLLGVAVATTMPSTQTATAPTGTPAP